MIAILALLLGCPLPPEEPKTNTNRTPQQNSGGAPVQQGQAGGGNNIGVPPTPGSGNAGKNPAVIQGAAGGAPGGAPGGVLHDLGQLKEQKTQKDILAGDHVQVRGTISGECNGPVRLDVLSLTDSPADTQTKGPLTGKDLEGTGEFVIAVPKDSSISLTALCDDNGDQKITEKDDKLSPGARIGKVDSDKDNVELVLESIQPPSGGPDGGSGAGGPGAGGPGAGGPGAGGPGAGNPNMDGDGSSGAGNEEQKEVPVE
ncbi:MAG: hypothetical protein CL916_05835 [Deltaproteobacteria bacterium]|nr:hypothetical protein [Deltaproteobacteria bacterium]